MARIPSTPQVPGEPPVDVQSDAAALDPDQSMSEAVTEAVAGPETEETVAVPKAMLDALMDRVQALESRPAVLRSPRHQAPLPDQSTIDLATLKTPVLTKQGWMVPETYGSNPAAPKAF